MSVILPGTFHVLNYTGSFLSVFKCKLNHHHLRIISCEKANVIFFADMDLLAASPNLAFPKILNSLRLTSLTRVGLEVTVLATLNRELIDWLAGSMNQLINLPAHQPVSQLTNQSF